MGACDARTQGAPIAALSGQPRTPQRACPARSGGPCSFSWSLSGGDRADRGLVDRVAGEAVELVGEHVARPRRVARRERRGVAVEVDALELLALVDLERDVLAAQPRAKPTGQEIALRLRPVHADRGEVGDLGPE